MSYDTRATAIKLSLSWREFFYDPPKVYGMKKELIEMIQSGYSVLVEQQKFPDDKTSKAQLNKTFEELKGRVSKWTAEVKEKDGLKENKSIRTLAQSWNKLDQAYFQISTGKATSVAVEVFPEIVQLVFSRVFGELHGKISYQVTRCVFRCVGIGRPKNQINL